MSVQERKQRERAERERLIVATARELAEEQGWDAVTTRRLAERIEYSQPVLYSHFRGSGDHRRGGPGGPPSWRRSCGRLPRRRRRRGRVTALARAYLDFAERNPAVYDAMFQLDGGLAFAAEDTPEALKDGFAALLETLRDVAGEGSSRGCSRRCSGRRCTGWRR